MLGHNLKNKSIKYSFTMKKLFTIVLAALGLVACTSQKKAEEAAQQQSKALVLYYSQTGTTQAVAEQIQQQLGADIEAIEVVNPYDGDYAQTIERCGQEMREGIVPEVKPLQAKLADYDLIFLGYPVWYGTYCQPIAGLVKQEAFEGKKIVTFCTFGSGGLQASTANLKAALPKADVVEGYGVRTARIKAVADEVNRFLIEGGYKEGEIEALPAFMEHKPVTDADVEVFNQACGNYQFPLGTPVTVAIRETATSTDYEFATTSAGPDGSESHSTIYVTKGKEEDAVAEFTQVVR